MNKLNAKYSFYANELTEFPGHFNYISHITDKIKVRYINPLGYEEREYQPAGGEEQSSNLPQSPQGGFNEHIKCICHL